MTNKPDDRQLDLGSSAFTGAAFMVATRFAVRLLGLISVTVLARLLTPEDFGLFGTAALTLGFFVLLKEMGFSEAVIRDPDLRKEDIDTLWTMRMILSIITALAVYFSAPFAADFLKDTRVTAVLQVMALLPIIDGLGSPASPLLLKDLKFATDFLLKSVNKIVQVTAVITVAFILKSYWALVFGALLSSIFGVVITHIARPYKPHISLSMLSKHQSFAVWTYIKSISFYFANSSDEFVVRSTASTGFFGIYHIARDLARVLIGDLIGPVREAMLPALSKMQNEPKRLAVAVSNIFGATLIVATALSFGIAMTASELVLLLLGDQWGGAAHFLSLLAIGCACNSIGEVNQSGFVAAGMQHKSALFWTLRAGIYGTGCVIAGLLYGPEAIALTFSLLSIIVLIFETRFLFNKLGVKTSMISLAFRPLLAGSLMAAALYFIPLSNDWPLSAILFTKIASGGLVYGCVMLILWKLVQFKEGPEHTLYSNLPEKLRKLVPLRIE